MPDFGIEVTAFGTGRGGKTYRFENDLTGKATLEEIREFSSRATYSVGKEILKEEVAKGFDKNARVRTDNKFGKPAILVNPFGKIEWFAKADVGPAVLEIYNELEKRSPLVTGQFITGNWLYFNGTQVAKNISDVRVFIKAIELKGGFKPNDEIRIVNVNPYARRLEYKGVRRGTGGRSKGKNQQKGNRTFKRKADGATLLRPNGSYYLTYRLIRRKFKSVATVMKFTFIPGNSNGISIPAITMKNGQSARTSFKKTGRPYLYPSIMFRLSGEGIKGEFNIE